MSLVSLSPTSHFLTGVSRGGKCHFCRHSTVIWCHSLIQFLCCFCCLRRSTPAQSKAMVTIDPLLASARSGLDQPTIYRNWIHTGYVDDGCLNSSRGVIFPGSHRPVASKGLRQRRHEQTNWGSPTSWNGIRWNSRQSVATSQVLVDPLVPPPRSSLVSAATARPSPMPTVKPVGCNIPVTTTPQRDAGLEGIQMHKAIIMTSTNH